MGYKSLFNPISIVIVSLLSLAMFASVEVIPANGESSVYTWGIEGNITGRTAISTGLPQSDGYSSMEVRFP